MFLITRIDEMLMNLLGTGATASALPDHANVFNTSVPDHLSGYPLVEFHEAGTVILTCSDGGVVIDSAMSDYVFTAYSDQDDYGQVEPAMDAVETDLLTLTGGIVRAGVRFTVVDRMSDGHEKEPLDRAGRRFVRAWQRWQIMAEVV